MTRQQQGQRTARVHVDRLERGKSSFPRAAISFLNGRQEKFLLFSEGGALRAIPRRGAPLTQIRSRGNARDSRRESPPHCSSDPLLRVLFQEPLRRRFSLAVTTLRSLPSNGPKTTLPTPRCRSCRHICSLNELPPVTVLTNRPSPPCHRLPK